MSLAENISPSCNLISDHGITSPQQTLRQTPVKREDDCTECETPLSSPEYESTAVRRHMTELPKQEIEPQSEYKPDVEEHRPMPALVGNSTKVLEEDNSKGHGESWPLSNIVEPGKNDVLFGRGGGTNHHDGNKRYRKMVEERKVDYVNSKRLDKPLVALDIIRQWRSQNPPGRFLKFDEKSDTWYDVGDKKAREKTSQALREKAPLLRKQQEEQMREIDAQPELMGHSENIISRESVRPSKNIARAMLAREHSLGCDYVPAEDLKNAMKGFSWDSNDGESNDGESESLDDICGSLSKAKEWGHPASHRNVTWPRPGMGEKVPLAPPPISNISREQTMESNNALPHLSSGNGTPSRSSFDEYASPYVSSLPPHVNQFQHQHRYETPPEPTSDEKPHGGWTKQRYDPTEYQHNYSQPRSLDYNHRGRGYWGNARPWQQGINDGSFGYHDPTVDMDPYSTPWEGYRHGYSYPPTVDNVAGLPNFSRTYEHWTSPNRFSGASHGRHFHGQHPQFSPHSASQTFNTGQNDEQMTTNGAAVSPYKRGMHHGHYYGEEPHSTSTTIPRPQPIKRETSHQNETSETKSEVKRMNRQCSTGSRRQNSLVSLGEVSERDMQNLGKNFRRSSLGGSKDDDVQNSLKKPSAISHWDRTLTIDQADIASAIEGNSSPLDGFKQTKPKTLYCEDRGNSLGSIAMDEIAVLMNKPPTIRAEDRSDTFGTVGTIESI